jgi:cytochrome b561
LLVTVHAFLANGLMMAVLFHMVLAFWHHCVQKDSVLINMLPRQKTTE